MLQQRTRQEAFTEFVSDIEPRLHLALIGSLGTELAREATAEALAWAWENWERVQEMHNPGGYLYRVARSKIRPWFRRSPVLPPPDTQAMPWVEPGLPDAIAKLSEQQRVVVLLVYAFGWTQAETARFLGIGHGATQKHAERGLARLRRHLGGEE